MRTFDQDLREGSLYNLVINGNMDFWQRGTTITRTQASNSWGRLADRHSAGMSATATARSMTINRSTSVPPSVPFVSGYSMEVVNNTSAGALGAAEWSVMYDHFVEGNLYAPYAGSGVTAGFWMYSSISIPIYSVAFRSASSAWSYVTTISVSTGWNYYTAFMPYPGGFTPATDTSYAILVTFGGLGGSSTTTSSLNTWVNTNVLGATTSSNWHTTAGATFRFAQVQMRAGQWAADDLKNSFVRTGANFMSELRLCQRYYEKSWRHDVAQASISGENYVVSYLWTANGLTYDNIAFQAEKRAYPTGQLYSPNSTSAGVVFMSGTGDVAANLHFPSQKGFVGTAKVATSYTSGQTISYHWTVDADY